MTETAAPVNYVLPAGIDVSSTPVIAGSLSRVMSLFSGWSMVALYKVSAAWMLGVYFSQPTLLPQLIAEQSGYAVIWTVMTVFIFLLADGIVIERMKWPALVFLVLPALLLVTVITIAVEAWSWCMTGVTQMTVVLLQNSIARSFHSVFLDALVVLGIATAIRIRNHSAARAVLASQLETQLANAQMQALRSQMQPHFLFNTLHSISSMVHRAPDRADKMISRLSDLLRMSLATSAQQTVPLATEIEFTRCYLDIQQIRFSDRLVVKWDIDAATTALSVPSFVLQALAENSVKHGLNHSEDGGEIRISTRRSAAFLLLEVADTGEGDDAQSDGTSYGIGLKNLGERLQRLYGPAVSVQFTKLPAGTTTVVTIPIR